MNQKTLEIKTFTIADVMAPTKKVLSDDSLFLVLAQAFDKTAHMLEDLQSKLGVDYILMRTQASSQDHLIHNGSFAS